MTVADRRRWSRFSADAVRGRDSVGNRNRSCCDQTSAQIVSRHCWADRSAGHDTRGSTEHLETTRPSRNSGRKKRCGFTASTNWLSSPWVGSCSEIPRPCCKNSTTPITHYQKSRLDPVRRDLLWGRRILTRTCGAQFAPAPWSDDRRLWLRCENCNAGQADCPKCGGKGTIACPDCDRGYRFVGMSAENPTGLQPCTNGCALGGCVVLIRAPQTARLLARIVREPCGSR